MSAVAVARLCVFATTAVPRLGDTGVLYMNNEKEFDIIPRWEWGDMQAASAPGTAVERVAVQCQAASNKPAT